MSASKYRTSCDACLDAKVKCSQSKPSCGRCNQGGQPCKYSQYRRLGRPPKRLAPDVSSHPPGDKAVSSSNRKGSPHLRSPPTIESRTKDHMHHLGKMYQANIRPKTDVHYLKSDNVNTLGPLDSMSVARLASAYESPPENLSATGEALSASFDLMPEFDCFDNFDLSASDFLGPGTGLGLSPSISSAGRLPTDKILDSRFPMETFTDFGQQSPRALTLDSLESRQDFSSPASPAYGSNYLLPAATQETNPCTQTSSRIPSTPDTRCQNRCYVSQSGLPQAIAPAAFGQGYGHCVRIGREALDGP